MSSLKIYHTVKGGEQVMTHDVVDKVSGPIRLKQIQSDGGFWSGDTHPVFIPYNAITYIEHEKSVDDAPAVTGAKYLGPERRIATSSHLPPSGMTERRRAAAQPGTKFAGPERRIKQMPLVTATSVIQERRKVAFVYPAHA